MSGLQGPSLQGPGRQNSPDPYADLVAMLRKQDQRIADLERGAILRTAGIYVAPGGMTIDSDRTSITGALDVAGAMRVLGTLSLPAGIIDNDALAAPVEYGSTGTSQLAFAVSAANVTFAAANMTVPPGFSRATILCMTRAGAINSTAVVDYLYVSASIGGTLGGSIPWRAGAGEYTAGSATAIRTLTGLSEGTISVGCAVRAGAAWASSASNGAHCDAVAWFSR